MIKPDKMTHGIVCRSQRVFGYFGWPSVARLKSGALAAVASGYRLGHVCPFGKVVICYSYDEGKSWTPPSVIIDTPLDDRDAGITVFGDKVIVTTFNNTRKFQLEYLKNADKSLSKFGKGDEKLIEGYIQNVTDADEERYLGSLYAVSSDGGYTFAEAQRVPVTAPHGMIILNDGSLFYVGCLFAAGGINQIYSVRSEDGVNFSKPVRIDIPEEYTKKGLSFAEPHAVCLNSGKILLLFRVDRGFSMYGCCSYDNGKTFTAPKPLGFYGAPPHLFKHSSGAVILSYSHRMEPYGQRARISLDEGESWGDEIVLRGDGFSADLGYPASVELRDKSILTVYYQRLDQADKNASVCCTNWNIK